MTVRRLWSTLSEADGRIVECIYCKRRIVVDTVEDAQNNWWHVQCAEETATREYVERVDDICFLGEEAAALDEIDLEVAAWDQLAREAV